MIQDIRIAFRSLTKVRGFTATALLTLGIGIGANNRRLQPAARIDPTAALRQD